MTDTHRPTIPRVLAEHTEMLDPATLTPHPKNPRRGDLDVIQQSIARNGWFGIVVRQQSTGHILKGNHSVKAAVALGLPAVPVMTVDVDDAHAERILLADNRTTDLAEYDDTALIELLEALSIEEFPATGWEPSDLDDLIAKLVPPDLDEVTAMIGEPTVQDGWPVLRLAIPPDVMAMWNEKVSEYDHDPVATLAGLLGM